MEEICGNNCQKRGLNRQSPGGNTANLFSSRHFDQTSPQKGPADESNKDRSCQFRFFEIAIEEVISKVYRIAGHVRSEGVIQGEVTHNVGTTCCRGQCECNDGFVARLRFVDHAGSSCVIPQDFGFEILKRELSS